MFPKHHAAQTQGSALPVWICTQLISFAAAEKKAVLIDGLKCFQQVCPRFWHPQMVQLVLRIDGCWSDSTKGQGFPWHAAELKS